MNIDPFRFAPGRTHIALTSADQTAASGKTAAKVVSHVRAGLYRLIGKVGPFATTRNAVIALSLTIGAPRIAYGLDATCLALSVAVVSGMYSVDEKCHGSASGMKPEAL
jgi:hypothetical protein